MIHLHLAEKMAQLQKQTVEHVARESWKFQFLRNKPIASPVQATIPCVPVCCAI